MNKITTILMAFLVLSTATAFTIGHSFDLGIYWTEQTDSVKEDQAHVGSVNGTEFTTFLCQTQGDWNAVKIEVKQLDETSCDWKVEYDGNRMNITSDENYVFFNIEEGKNINLVAIQTVSQGVYDANKCLIDGNYWVG